MSKESKEKKEAEQAVEDEVTQTQETAEVQEPSREEELEQKLKDSEEKYMRMAAEYDNYKKRTQREKEARYDDAVIDTVAAFVPIIDNIERAIAVEVESEEAKKILEGVNMVKKQFDDVLKNLKVSPIEAVGNEFDPNFHNAVMHIEDEGITDNTVVEEFMKGYIYKDTRVVRHSMVKVAN